MNTFFGIVIIVLMALVVISLVKGLAAFMRGMREDVDQARSTGATEMQLRQNQMMFARIKYQALAILVVGVLLAMNR